MKLNIIWAAGDLLWIPAALSTIKPATSSRLSIIQLKLGGRSLRYLPEDQRERLVGDLRLIEKELARIEREFMGVLDLTVTRYPGFEVGDFSSNIRSSLTDLSA